MGIDANMIKSRSLSKFTEWSEILHFEQITFKFFQTWEAFSDDSHCSKTFRQHSDYVIALAAAKHVSTVERFPLVEFCSY